LLPEPGQIVRVRSRRYLVEVVLGGPAQPALLGHPAMPARESRVRMSCLDDDAQGEELEVVWEREVAATLRIPLATVKRLLRCLVVAGDLATTGEGKATRYALPRVDDRPANDAREAAALALLARDGRITRQGLADAAELSTRTAGRVLAELVARGAIVPDGRKGKAGGYVVPGRAAA
jgi:hypothetical protein